MRKVYCIKHGEASDFAFHLDMDGKKIEKHFCFECFMEFLEKNVNQVEIKEELENGKDETEKCATRAGKCNVKECFCDEPKKES